jgi:hypothetical protein
MHVTTKLTTCWPFSLQWNIFVFTILFYDRTVWEKGGEMELYILITWHSLTAWRYSLGTMINEESTLHCWTLNNRNACKGPHRNPEGPISIVVTLLIGRLGCDAIGSNHWTLQHYVVCGHTRHPIPWRQNWRRVLAGTKFVPSVQSFTASASALI